MGRSKQVDVEVAEGMLKPFGPKAHNFAYRHASLDAKITLLEGSVSSSKTWAMMVKLCFLSQYRVAGRKIIAGFSRASVYTNVLSDLFDFLGPNNYKYNQQTGLLEFLGSRWLVLGVAEEGSDKRIRGATIGCAYLDEASLLPNSFMLMLRTRLRVDGARLYMTSNPDSPLHPIYTDLMTNPELKPGIDIEVIHFVISDNPNLPAGYKASLERQYHGLFKLRFIDGLWVAAEGSIYGSCFSEDLEFTEPEIDAYGNEVYGPTTRPRGLYGVGGWQRRIIGVDCGVHNAQAYIEFLDDGRVLWGVQEYYWDSVKQFRQKTDAEYADDLERFLDSSPTKAGRDATVIVDPSAASFKVELLKRGIFCKDADNEVIDGIRMVSTMFGNRLLRFHKDKCQNAIAEHRSYAWDPKAAKLGVEKPIKFRDHTCFVAGTQIATETGQVAIEEIRTGDMVVTPKGVCRVIAAQSTGTKAVWAFRTILGTPEHPIWSDGDFKPMAALEIGDTICLTGEKYSVVEETAKCTGQIREVFALQTEHGCYYANGILVSNCDLTRYVVKTEINAWRLSEVA